MNWRLGNPRKGQQERMKDHEEKVWRSDDDKAKETEGNIVGGSHGEPKRRRQGHAHPRYTAQKLKNFKARTPKPSRERVWT